MYTLEDDKETTSSLRKQDVSAELSRRQSISSQITRGLGAINRASTQIATPTGAGQNGKAIAFAALAIACVSVFFTAMDQTVVVTALPPMITDLGIGPTKLDHAAWIISAYLLGFIIAMPLMGRVSDIFGRRRIFLLCLSIFGIGSILCGLAPFFAQLSDLGFLNNLGIDTSSPGLIYLIAARFLQAIGGGAVVPVAMAIASDFYGEARRSLALGVIGAVTEAGGVVGPLYGAIIVQQFGWQYIFYFNVPIVIVIIILAWFLIPRSTRLREGIDWLGALLLGGALTCLSLGLAQQGTDLGPTPANTPAPQNNPIALALAVVLFIVFILVERKVRWPVVDLSLFKRFPFSAASFVSLLVGAALIIAMADIPIFVDTVLNRPVLDSGLALMRMTVMIPIGALLGGWLCSRVSCRVTGIIGLLFAAAGFYLMSRWPMNVGWTQITISTVTAGLGFGLVIAPISTTAINAVRTTQAGIGSAIVTALRMTGMILGLAALTSWALAYFKQLASQYPSLPLTATTAQFIQWSKGYAAHLILSAHTVYSEVFFVTMFLCLIAIIPAIFLWGRDMKVGAVFMTPMPAAQSVAAQSAAAQFIAPVTAASVADEPADPDAATVVILAPEAGSIALAATDILHDPALPAAFGAPPLPPNVGGDSGNGGGKPRRRRRRLIIALACLLLLLLLIGAGIFAALSWQAPNTASNGTSGAPTATPTVVSGPRMIDLALDQGALTSLFVSQLGLQQGAITNMKVTPVAQDGIVLTLNLNIDADGVSRVMPVELDTTIGLDQHQNIQLAVHHLKRDGSDAGAAAAASMQQALNHMLISQLMPALHGQLKGVQLLSVHTSNSTGCGKNTEMLILLVKAPPIQGIAAQPTPAPFCLKGPITINQLLPS
ncbi:MAG: MFS transporter [Ktedonobacteraceae bacterium]